VQGLRLTVEDVILPKVQAFCRTLGRRQRPWLPQGQRGTAPAALLEHFHKHLDMHHKESCARYERKMQNKGSSSIEHLLRSPLRFWLSDLASSNDAEGISVGADLLCLTFGCP
jgi:hypothetical protein